MKVFLAIIINLGSKMGFCQTAQWQEMPLLRLSAYEIHNPDVFSFSVNQASLAEISKFSFGIYSDRKFMMNELGQAVALIAAPTSIGNFGFRGFRTGNEDFNETTLGFSYARKLTENFLTGIQFNYYSRIVLNYGKETAVNAELGFLFRISGNLSTGIHIYNPTGVSIGKSSEKLASAYTVGLGYAPSKKLFLAIDIRKVEDQPVSVHSGFHYRLLENVRISAGLASAVSSFYFGICFNLKNISTTVIASNHNILGWSPGLAVSYQKQK